MSYTLNLEVWHGRERTGWSEVTSGSFAYLLGLARGACHIEGELPWYIRRDDDDVVLAESGINETASWLDGAYKEDDEEGYYDEYGYMLYETDYSDLGWDVVHGLPEETEEPAPTPTLWTQYVSADHDNKGEWDRTIALASRLRDAGLWGGNCQIYIYDPQTCYDELSLYDTLPSIAHEGDALVVRPFRGGAR